MFDSFSLIPSHANYITGISKESTQYMCFCTAAVVSACNSMNIFSLGVFFCRWHSIEYAAVCDAHSTQIHRPLDDNVPISMLSFFFLFCFVHAHMCFVFELCQKKSLWADWIARHDACESTATKRPTKKKKTIAWNKTNKKNLHAFVSVVLNISIEIRMKHAHENNQIKMSRKSGGNVHNLSKY